jgi:hypothetical protein
MYSQFYSWANIAHRLPVSVRQRIAYLEFALLYRKFGKATCCLGKMFGMRNLAKLAKAVAYPVQRKWGWLDHGVPDSKYARVGKLEHLHRLSGVHRQSPSHITDKSR